MKSARIIIIGTFLILLFGNFVGGLHHSDKKYVEVYFSNKLEIGDLVKIKSDLLDKKIKLNYNYLKFSSDGKLSAIEYHVTAFKVGGSDKTENLDKEIGFIINTEPQPKYGIIVGTKESIQKRREVLEN